MKNRFKILTLLIALLVSINGCLAISVSKIDKAVKKAPFADAATIALSIKDVKNGKTVYEYNQNKLLHPASTLKILTGYEAYNVLGNDYYFKTEFYKDSANNLYIKLGADPILTSSQLKKAVSEIKAAGNTSFSNLYIDDSIIDRKEFPVGVMWDDDISYYTPKVSAYNLDGNVLKINVAKGKGELLETTVKNYPTGIVSSLKTGEKQDIRINRYNWNNPELIEITGSMNELKPVMIPVSSMRRYFIHSVSKALQENRIAITNSSYSSKMVPNNATLLTQIANPITDVMPKALQDSNNLIAETLFKLSAGKYYTTTGSDEAGVAAFRDFYNKKGLKSEDVIIIEGSGVSRNNLVSTEWMTKALDTIYKSSDFEGYKEYMAQPGDGTLKDRLLEMRGDAYLKTGSLSNVSAISGYVYSKDGNVYSVCLLIQNFKDKSSDIKSFEDEIIKLIYSK